jgi:dsRNA-specific ribonuclease
MISTTETEEPIIYSGSRGTDFQYLIRKILKNAKIKDHYIDALLDEDGFKKYDIAFTSKTANEVDNYEVYEQLGDLSANKFIVSYMYRKFPKLKCSECVKIVARLRILYGSKQTFCVIAENLGFWPFISADEEQRNTEKKKLLEDTFEAFIGVTELMIDEKIRHNVGYAIVYEILHSVFETVNISLKYEDLYDAKTRLKELFDLYNKGDSNIGTLQYEETKDLETRLTTSLVYQKISPTHRILLGQGVASLKADAQQRAASVGIQKMNSKGYVKQVPHIYISLCNEYMK